MAKVRSQYSSPVIFVGILLSLPTITATANFTLNGRRALMISADFWAYSSGGQGLGLRKGSFPSSTELIKSSAFAFSKRFNKSIAVSGPSSTFTPNTVLKLYSFIKAIKTSIGNQGNLLVSFASCFTFTVLSKLKWL